MSTIREDLEADLVSHGLWPEQARDPGRCSRVSYLLRAFERSLVSAVSS